MSHEVKVSVALPDSEDDAPVATIVVDCEVCGVEEVTLPLAHLGVVLRTLDIVMANLSTEFDASPGRFELPDEEDRAAMKRTLDKVAPGWSASLR